MKKISHNIITKYIKNLENNFDRVYADYVSKYIIIEMPCGELLNTKIRGYVWAWTLKRNYKILSLTGKERFKAQGLEGKIHISTNLITGLLVYRDIPKYRCNLLIKKTKEKMNK